MAETITAERLDAEIAHWQSMDATVSEHASPEVRERIRFLRALCRAHAAAIRECENYPHGIRVHDDAHELADKIHAILTTGAP